MITQAARDEIARGTPADWLCHILYMDGQEVGLSTPVPPDHDFRGHTEDYFPLSHWFRFQIGDRVMGGEGDCFDVGTIHGIDAEMADVGWESGQRTPAYLADLAPYDGRAA